jgi:hypothetical protein
MSPRRMPMVQVNFFVGMSSIYQQCMAFNEATRLMSIMAMASHGWLKLLLCCLCCEGI